MELSSTTQSGASANGEIALKMHKKAQDIEKGQAQQLLNTIPQPAKTPGMGNGVDVMA